MPRPSNNASGQNGSIGGGLTNHAAGTGGAPLAVLVICFVLQLVRENYICLFRI